MSHAASRPAIALIHGWGIGKAAWQPLSQALTPHFDIHLVELPGYGAEPANPGAFDDAARRMVEALPAGVTLCGWSLGGMLALQATLLAPERVGGLILIGSTPSFTQRADWPHAQPATLLDAFIAAVAENPSSTLQRFIALLNQGDVQAKTASRTLLQALKAEPLPDADSLVQGLGWLRDIDLRQPLAALTLPTLLIHGEQDPLMPLAAAQWLHAALKNSQLEIVPGAAHAPFINTPEGIAKLIGDYCHASALHQATRSRVV